MVPAWLRDWSVLVIALFLILVSVTGVASALVGRVKDFVFGKVVGSFVESATAQARQRDHEMRERERQASLRYEQNQRLGDAVDKLTEALNGYVTASVAGWPGSKL